MEKKQPIDIRMNICMYMHTVQLEGNLTKTCGWQAKKMRVNLVNMPQICTGAHKGKHPLSY